MGRDQSTAPWTNRLRIGDLGFRETDGAAIGFVGGVAAGEHRGHGQVGGGVPDLRALSLAFEDDELTGLVEPGLDRGSFEPRGMQRHCVETGNTSDTDRAVGIASDGAEPVLNPLD